MSTEDGMNHISKSFLAKDGRSYASHYWEQRESGYRRIALIVGGGFRPVDQETRLIRFLLDRGFCAFAIDLAYGAPSPRKPRLRAFREAIADFAATKASPELPFYLFASSFSAGALLPKIAGLPGLAAAALIGPVVEFPPPRLKRSCFLLPFADLALGAQDLCGEPELREGLIDKDRVFRFRKADLKAAAADLDAFFASPLGFPLAAFSGEDDPFLTERGRASLASAGAKLYAYPRVKHEPGRDRYADNFYADLGLFIDEVAAGKKAR
jgi:alpha-beta hydrolase superfamily lysophospholipase